MSGTIRPIHGFPRRFLLVPSWRSVLPRFLIRHAVKHALCILLYYSGACHLFSLIRRRLSGARLIVLAYHSVGANSSFTNLTLDFRTFDAQMAYLSTRYKVLSMDEVTETLRSGRSFTEDAVAITFDDGYRDNYDWVFPILRKYNLPATIYLTTGRIDSGFPTHFYALLLAITSSQGRSLDMRRYRLRTYDLTTRRGKEQAVLEIDGYARGLNTAGRDTLLDDILRQLGLRRDSSIFGDRMLTWDQIRQMQATRITFGSHTVTHPVLSLLDPARSLDEIRTSKRRIEENLGTCVTLFAYPYGGRHDVHSQVMRSVAESGFMSAVLLSDNGTAPNHPYAVGRTMVGNEMTTGLFGTFSRAVFGTEVTGLLDALRRRFSHLFGRVDYSC